MCRPLGTSWQMMYRHFPYLALCCKDWICVYCSMIVYTTSSHTVQCMYMCGYTVNSMYSVTRICHHSYCTLHSTPTSCLVLCFIKVSLCYRMRVRRSWCLPLSLLPLPAPSPGTNTSTPLMMSMILTSIVTLCIHSEPL